jgi:hypothetical protein
MEEIHYTRHAKNRMRWRKIAEEEIASAIRNPDFTETADNNINVWKQISDKYLRVTYREETAHILVITAVKKKKGWR